MQIQYTKHNGKASEVCISAGKDEWLDLSQAVKANGSLSSYTGDDPSPYEAYCTSLTVEIVASQNVAFSVLGDELQVKGCSESLRKLSNSIIAFAQEYESGEHFHLDCIDSDYISSESAFVVLSLKEGTGQP